MDEDPQSESLKIVDRFIRNHSYTYRQNCLLLLSHLKVLKSHQLCKPSNLCFAWIAMTIERTHALMVKGHQQEADPQPPGVYAGHISLLLPVLELCWSSMGLILHRTREFVELKMAAPRAVLSTTVNHWNPKPKTSTCKRPWMFCSLEVDKATLQNTMQLSTPSNMDCGGLSSWPQFLPPVLILISFQDAVSLSYQSHHPCSLCAECHKWEAKTEWLHCHCAYAVHAVEAELLEIVFSF